MEYQQVGKPAVFRANTLRGIDILSEPSESAQRVGIIPTVEPPASGLAVLTAEGLDAAIELLQQGAPPKTIVVPWPEADGHSLDDLLGEW